MSRMRTFSLAAAGTVAATVAGLAFGTPAHAIEAVSCTRQGAFKLIGDDYNACYSGSGLITFAVPLPNVRRQWCSGMWSGSIHLSTRTQDFVDNFDPGQCGDINPDMGVAGITLL